MQTWVCAILFIIVGYLLAVLIGMIMGHGKVKDTNKLNRDNVIGLMDGFSLLVSFVIQKIPDTSCNPIPSAEFSKQIYNDLLLTYSESDIVGMVNQILNYSNNGYTQDDINTFYSNIAVSFFKILSKYCPTKPKTQAPNNYNLGPFQYMARNG